MTENKQIQEMANDIAKICPNLVEDCCGQVNCVTHLTLSLSKIGYRKASEVAKEVIADIRQSLINMVLLNITGEEYDLAKAIADVEKKYTEVEK